MITLPTMKRQLSHDDEAISAKLQSRRCGQVSIGVGCSGERSSLAPPPYSGERSTLASPPYIVLVNDSYQL